MFPFGQFLPLVGQTFFSLFREPIFWIVVLIVFLLYRKMCKTTAYFFTTPGESPWRLTLSALFFGILGGLGGSLLLILVGISLNEIGGGYLLLTALGLMLIQQRFLCFAYAGGILSLVYLLFGFPQISVPQVLALVAILHLVEALLIYFTGNLAPLPVYVAWGNGQIVGAYNLQKFWPLPLVLLFAGVCPQPEIIKGLVSMPAWWPLLKPEFMAWEGDVAYSLLALPAILGYGDVAVTMSPREKTKLAGWELAGYSLLLLFLAVGASHYRWLAYPAALFAPLGHELVIYLGRRREAQGEPLFVFSPEGQRLLDVTDDRVGEQPAVYLQVLTSYSPLRNWGRRLKRRWTKK